MCRLCDLCGLSGACDASGGEPIEGFGETLDELGLRLLDNREVQFPIPDWEFLTELSPGAVKFYTILVEILEGSIMNIPAGAVFIGSLGAVNDVELGCHYRVKPMTVFGPTLWPEAKNTWMSVLADIKLIEAYEQAKTAASKRANR